MYPRLGDKEIKALVPYFIPWETKLVSTPDAMNNQIRAAIAQKQIPKVSMDKLSLDKAKGMM